MVSPASRVASTELVANAVPVLVPDSPAPICEDLCSARPDGDAPDRLDVDAIDRGANHWGRALVIGKNPSAAPLVRRSDRRFSQVERRLWTDGDGGGQITGALDEGFAFWPLGNPSGMST